MVCSSTRTQPAPAHVCVQWYKDLLRQAVRRSPSLRTLSCVNACQLDSVQMTYGSEVRLGQIRALNSFPNLNRVVIGEDVDPLNLTNRLGRSFRLCGIPRDWRHRLFITLNNMSQMKLVCDRFSRNLQRIRHRVKRRLKRRNRRIIVTSTNRRLPRRPMRNPRIKCARTWM